jgi:hypothetical protein
MVAVAALAANVPQEYHHPLQSHPPAGEPVRPRARWQSIILTFRPPIFDRHVLAHEIFLILQSVVERAQTDRTQVSRCAAEKTD